MNKWPRCEDCVRDNYLRAPVCQTCVAGSNFFKSGICLRENKIPFTRYVFFREKDILSVLFISFLPECRNDFILKFPAIKIGFFYDLQLAVIKQHDLIAEIKRQIHNMSGENGNAVLFQ